MQIYKIKSEIFNGEATIFHSVFRNSATDTIKTTDGVEYSAYETKVLMRNRKPMPQAVHVLKKAFSGTLISIEKKKGGEYGEVGTARI